MLYLTVCLFTMINALNIRLTTELFPVTNRTTGIHELFSVTNRTTGIHKRENVLTLLAASCLENCIVLFDYTFTEEV